MKLALPYIIFAIFFVSTLPQLQQTIQTGDAHDLNWLNLILNILGNALFGLYEYLQGNKGMSVLGFYFVAYWGILLYYKSKENSQ